MSAALARGGGWAGPAVLILGLLVGLAISQEPVVVAILAVGLGVAAFGVAVPTALVAMMFCSVLFDRLGLTGAEVAEFPVTLSKLSVLGALGLWTVHALLARRPLVRWHPVMTGLGLLCATSAVSTVANSSFNASKFTLLGFGMMLVLVGLVYAVLAEVELGPLYRGLSAFFAASLAVSLMQSRGSAGEAARASGTFGDPNEWATLVLLVSAVLLGGLARDDHPMARPLRVALFLLTPAGVLLSGSRSALLVGCVAAVGLVALLWAHKGELALAVGGAVVATPFVVDVDIVVRRLSSLVENLQGGAVVQDTSLIERAELLRQGWDLFANHWLVGVGPGRFKAATGFVSADGRLRPAHNSYLEIAAEQGLMGLTAAGLFGAIVVWTLVVAWRRAPSAEHRSRIQGAAVGLASVALMAATLGLLTFSMAYLLLGFSLAVVHQSEAARRRAEGAALELA